MSNEALRDQVTEVLALVREQLSDIARVQKKQAELTASASVADEMVEVTVDVRGHVVKTVIDEAYLDDYEFDELGDHITEAAQAAVRAVGRRVAEMMVPINERRKAFPALSEIVEGAPDLRDLVPPGLDPFAAAQTRPTPDDGESTEETAVPTLRR